MQASQSEKRNIAASVRRILLRLLCVLLVTVVAVAAFLYGVMALLCRGPSPTARDLFVLSTRETSAIGFLPRMFLSDEKIAEIEDRRSALTLTESSDSALVTVQNTHDGETPQADAWGYTDEDGDGLILVPVAGESFTGHMLIVLDPSRVVLGCVPEDFANRGYTLAELAERFGAVAGINAGGFDDPNGMGDGRSPNTATVSYGEMYLEYKGIGGGWVGIDGEGILHVGLADTEEIADKHIQHGTGYGPVLVLNGQTPDPEALVSGLNPRTAIGQRSDGAILMLVIAGRQPNSLGATYVDEASLMLRFGAVNACNLDGGTSSLLWLDGDYYSSSATVVGIRRIPTSFLVMPREVNGNG